MTLLVSHRKNPDLHVTIKSGLPPDEDGNTIHLDLPSDGAGRALPMPWRFEFTLAEFCKRVKDILRELKDCGHVSPRDPRVIFLGQLRESELVDGFQKSICPETAMSKRIQLPESTQEEEIPDILTEAQANILTAAAYVIQNTDVAVARTGGGELYFDDPRLDLIEFARTMAI